MFLPRPFLPLPSLRRRASLIRALRIARVPAVAGPLMMAAMRAEAQAWNYPSLQVPSVSERDYTAALSSGGGSSLLFQWREGFNDAMHLGLDAGFADVKGRSALQAFVGGTLGYDLTRATKEQPLDLLLTGGVGLGFGAGTSLFRLPVGVSIGHTFDLDDGLAVTPYVHPRLSLDACSDCGRQGRTSSELSLSFDLGAEFRVNRRFSVRAAAAFTGSEVFGGNDAFAVGVTWTPPGLRR